MKANTNSLHSERVILRRSEKRTEYREILDFNIKHLDALLRKEPENTPYALRLIKFRADTMQELNQLGKIEAALSNYTRIYRRSCTVS